MRTDGRFNMRFIRRRRQICVYDILFFVIIEQTNSISPGRAITSILARFFSKTRFFSIFDVSRASCSHQKYYWAFRKIASNLEKGHSPPLENQQTAHPRTSQKRVFHSSFHLLAGSAGKKKSAACFSRNVDFFRRRSTKTPTTAVSSV